MNNEFKYFLYGTKIINEEEISNIFTEGIINPHGENLDSILTPIDIPNGDILNRTRATSPDINGNDIFVIRIPKRYLEPMVINGNLKDCPFPIWKKIDTPAGQDKISILAPELVYGVYSKEKDDLKLNPKRSPVFDPTGMQYDDSQIQYFAENELVYWQLFAEERRRRTFDELVKSDEKLRSWDYALEIYSGHFVSPISRKKAV